MDRRQYLALCGAVTMGSLSGCQSPTDTLQSDITESDDVSSTSADTSLETVFQKRSEQLPWLGQSDASRSGYSVLLPIVSTNETPTQGMLSTAPDMEVQYMQTVPSTVPTESLQTKSERAEDPVFRHSVLQSLPRVSYNGDILIIEGQIEKLKDQILTPETSVVETNLADGVVTYTAGEQIVLAGYGDWTGVLTQSSWQQKMSAQLIGTVDKTRQFDTYTINTLLDATPFVPFKTDVRLHSFTNYQLRLLSQWATVTQPRVSDRAREAYPNSIEWVCGIRTYDVTSTAGRDALYEMRRLAVGQSQDGILGVRTPIVTIDRVGESTLIEYLELPLPPGDVIPWSVTSSND